MKPAFAAVLMTALVPAFAQTGPTVEWTQTSDHLSHGNTNWHSEELRLSSRIAPRQSIEGSLRQTRRFGLSDTQADLNYTFPLTQALTGTVSAGNSTTHRVLPKSDIGASLQYEFAPAWLVNLGAKNTEYDNASAARINLGVEHYFSAFRWAIDWRPTRAVGVTAHSTDARFDYYYNDTDSVGILVAAGQEASNVDGRGVVVSSVRTAAVVGRHGLNRNWLLRYGIERVKQGDFYHRTGIRLGAQYAF
jgi:YaiO family outer membrane protein